MLDDALKTTRNISNLILLVSIVSIIFALSSEFPRDINRYRTDLINLQKIRFSEYDKHVKDLIDLKSRVELQKFTEGINNLFKTNGVYILNSEDLANKFIDPLYYGMILTKDLVLGDIKNATLNQMDQLNELIDLNHNCQYIIPDINDFAKSFDSFFAVEKYFNYTIENIVIELDSHNFSNESFMKNTDQIEVNVYFELRKDRNTPSARVFNTTFRATLYEIPNSSWINWLVESKNDSNLFSIKNNTVKWLPYLDNKSRSSYRDMKISELMINFENEIRQNSPSNKAINIMGASISGVLIAYASPSTLIALEYILLTYLGQISLFVASKKDAFREFCWLPLIKRKEQKYTSIALIMILPIISISILEIKLASYINNVYFLGIFALISICIIIVFSLGSIKTIKNINNNLQTIS